MNVFIAAVIRAVMLGVGVWTGDQGWEDEQNIQLVGGAVLVVAALVWSMIEKKRLVARGSKPSTGVRLRSKSEPDKVQNRLLGEDDRKEQR